MLASQQAIRVVLWLGKGLPRTAPPRFTEALTRIEVTNDAERGDGFQLSFSLAKEAAQDFNLLKSDLVDVWSRVILGVVIGSQSEVLIDGLITRREVGASSEPGMSTLTVTGRDVSVGLDLEEKNEKYAGQPDSVIARRLLAGYAEYGLVALVTDTKHAPLEQERVPRQHETDLAFVRRLAERNGFVFYIEPQSFGVNRAHWGPEDRFGVPQPALTLNMGPATNIKELSFSEDGLAPLEVEGSILDARTKKISPVYTGVSLRASLSASPREARRKQILRQIAHKKRALATTAATAAASLAPEAVTGEGEIDALRYGRVLRARRLVGVRGAGVLFQRPLLRSTGDAPRSATASTRRSSPSLETARVLLSSRCVHEWSLLWKIPGRRDGQRRPSAPRAHPGQSPRRHGG